MLNIRTTMRTGYTSLIAVLVIGLTPMTTFADASSDAAAHCIAPVSSQNGTRTPTGADAVTYTYQCDGPNSGNWINDYYVYSPTTNDRTARYAPNYTFDCAGGTWSSDSWNYSPSANAYRLSRIQVSAPSNVPTNCPIISPPLPTPGSTTIGSSKSSEASPATNQNTGSTGTSPATSTVVGGSSSLNTKGASNSTIGNSTDAKLNNNIISNGSSGNSLVLGNTTGGNAATGNVVGDATVINNLQSASNALGYGTNVKTFTANINGNVNGDLLFDPGMLKNVQNASTNTDFSNKLSVNNSTNASINNNINVGAKSGDATVTGNTSGGDATSGNATALVKVINMINSAVTSGQSFIGTININGNLNGDILLPANFIDQLVASNVPTVNVTVPDSNNAINTHVVSDSNVTNTNNFGVKNNINSAAASGSATVSDNTSGGQASSGAANTEVINAFNLTGSNIIGKNSMLVFVNVIGKWVGLIVNAPAGATAAEIGGNITQNTNIDHTYKENNKLNAGINNSITTASQSGNASVTGNTSGGNAKSGNANTVVDLANLENSNHILTGWFGILYINVFGSWNGSFGVNTSAGDAPVATNQDGRGASNSGIGSNATNASQLVPSEIMRFVPNSSGSYTTIDGSAGVVDTHNVASPQAVLAAATTNAASTAALVPPLRATKSSNWTLPIGLFIMAIVLFASDRISARGRLNK
jgi:hypothetical protein